jgi:hypothetical protein
LAVWLDADISELERDRDFRFAAVDSVGHGGWTIQKTLNQAPLGLGTLGAKHLYDFNNMGVDLG